MIAKLKGIVDGIRGNQLVLDVNGVGYSLLCSNQTLGQLPPIGSFANVSVEVLIRQDNITLFGFFTEEEREAFKLLLTVQGVGGKVCLSLLSSISPATLQTCLLTQDHLPLTQAEGVGPKLAMRIVHELKGKTLLTGSLPGVTASIVPLASVSQDALSALMNLGYRRQDVAEALAKVHEDMGADLSLDALIPQTLKRLSKANG
ncbi:MAG: Holliday junction branch migration protein RuvA [Alphaproteobacteria bacterium]